MYNKQIEEAIEINELVNLNREEYLKARELEYSKNKEIKKKLTEVGLPDNYPYKKMGLEGETTKDISPNFDFSFLDRDVSI